MDDFSILVNHRHSELLLICSKNRETIGWTAEHGAIDRLHRTGQRRRGIDYVVDVVALLLDVLEVVDVAAGINRHIIIFMEDRQKALLHVEALTLLLRGVGVDRMMAYHDDPVFLGILQGFVEP